MHIALSFCHGDQLLSAATAMTRVPWQDQDSLKATMSQLMLAAMPETPPIRIQHPTSSN
jgi:hypothetical protein